MPDYEYKCESCLKIISSFFPMKDGPAPAVMCSCGNEAFRVFSSPGVQFKGGGWGGQ
jgi:putative FmdB family regulatory protein